MLIGTAEILPVQPSPQHIKAYLEKYEQGIRDIGVTIDEFRKEYSVAIRITPESVRGF